MGTLQNPATAPYVLTKKGWAASFPRRAGCGHILCNGQEACLYFKARQSPVRPRGEQR